MTRAPRPRADDYVRSIHRRLPAIGVHQRESGDYRHAVVWNDAFPPGVGGSIPVRPSGPTTELSVQLVAVVVALITPDTPAFGAALPLNCIA